MLLVLCGLWIKEKHNLLNIARVAASRMHCWQILLNSWIKIMYILAIVACDKTAAIDIYIASFGPQIKNLLLCSDQDMQSTNELKTIIGLCKPSFIHSFTNKFTINFKQTVYLSQIISIFKNSVVFCRWHIGGHAGGGYLQLIVTPNSQVSAKLTGISPPHHPNPLPQDIFIMQAIVSVTKPSKWKKNFLLFTILHLKSNCDWWSFSPIKDNKINK